jgi:hypothetical protein
MSWGYKDADYTDKIRICSVSSVAAWTNPAGRLAPLQIKLKNFYVVQLLLLAHAPAMKVSCMNRA